MIRTFSGSGEDRAPVSVDGADGFFLRPGFSSGGDVSVMLPPDIAHQATPKERFNDPDAAWMARSIAVAMENNGLSSPNPVVGCVLVRDGREIASGATEQWGGRHAERVVVEQADGIKTDGATAYITLEPCSHRGRQPPCANLLASLKLARCVVAVADPNPLICGAGFALLRSAGVAVRSGVLGFEAAAWHLPFLTMHRHGRPFFAAKWAQTLDGQLAFDSGHVRWISGPAARAHAHWLRQKYDAVLIGANTALMDKPSLTVRDCALQNGRQPVRLIFDPNGRLLDTMHERISEWRQTFMSDAAPTIFLVRQSALELHRDVLHLIPFEKAIVPLPDGDKVLDAVPSCLSTAEVAELAGRRITSVLVEGGPTLLSLFLEIGLVDVAHVFVAPSIGGGARGRMVNRQPSALLDPVVPFSLVRLGCDVLVEYIRAESAWHLSRHVKEFSSDDNGRSPH